MSDYLTEIGKHPVARKLIKQLGLPLPVPPNLNRRTTPWRKQELGHQTVAMWSTPDSDVLPVMARAVLDGAAKVTIDADSAAHEGLEDLAERRGRALSEYPADGHPSGSFDAMVLDATDIERPEQLNRLYEFFQPPLKSMERNGRLVVVGRPPEEAADHRAAAAQRGLEGFVRSLAKEVGRFGTTAQLLRVEEGAEDRLAGPLTFVLSPRSAYVSGQPILVRTRAGQHPRAGQWRQPLEDQVAVVTGAGRGIGRAASRAFAREGADVVCVDLPGGGVADDIAQEVRGEALPLDITDPDASDRLAEVAEQRGGFDIVLHNAGITRDRTLANMKEESWRTSLEVNLQGAMRLTDELLERDLINGYGRIVCMSSIAGIAGNVGQTNYATAKAGLIGWARRLSERLADDSITVNAVAPGFIETRLTDEIPFMVREFARRLNALSQGGEPEDVAEALTFLATPAAQGITGDVLRVCGGAFVGA